MHKRSKQWLFRWTLGAYVLLMGAWVAAWLTKLSLDHQYPWLTSDAGGFTYWTLAKLIIWIVPALVLIRASGRPVGHVFNLANWGSWLKWGGGIGALIALTGILPKLASGLSLVPLDLSFALLSVLVVAPLFEELFVRGAIMGNLEQAGSFWMANILSSLMFVGLHLPGWYFMGTLIEQLTRPIGGVVSIFLLGLLFGYAVHRSKSLMGGVVAHFLNNLSSLR